MVQKLASSGGKCDEPGNDSRGSVIRKRTPDEQARAEASDPKAAYDARMEKRGLKRKTMLTRIDAFDTLRDLNALLKGSDGDKVLSDLRSFVAKRG
ncbi:hypothetical protein [Terasakiella pusilla]|uniref:hypothetical protein n=1 Tax=Terasakiella pusilla TaxID=64973 RepID=UPI003AA9381A